MASFRKIGGRTRNLNISNKTKIEPNAESTKVEPTRHEQSNHEMHIAQIQSEQNQSVFYPLMSDNETPRYFEDAGLYYCFNQTVQDFVLNADHFSVTNIFNVDTLAFADGSTMSSAPNLDAKEELNLNPEAKDVYNRYVELNTDESNQVVLPTCGVYLITYYLNSGESRLFVTFDEFNEMCFDNATSGTFTIHYDDNLLGVPLNKNQTRTPCLYLKMKIETDTDTDTKIEKSHVTITRIAQ